MTEGQREGVRRLIDAASSALLPVVVFIVLPTDVVVANARELVYSPEVVRVFAAAAVVSWLVALWIVRRFRGRLPARLLIAIPAAVLLFDVVGATLEKAGVALPAMALADIGVIVAVLLAANVLPWQGVQNVAALCSVAFSVQCAVSPLPRAMVAAAGTALPPSLGARVPGAQAPGNVYHLLLDNYQSESYAALAASDPKVKYSGFTFFSRFNTEFPHTSSSEVALIEGRLPRAGLSIGDWPRNALRTGFWRDLAGAGVGLWIYPYNSHLCPEFALKCLTSADVGSGAQGTVLRDTTIDLWALRLVPASARRLLDAWAAGPHRDNAEETAGFSVTKTIGTALHHQPGTARVVPVQVNASPRQYFNLRQFDELLADEPHRPARGQYVYYHALIPHPEYILDERCEPRAPSWASAAYWAFARCANLMVRRLVNELARLGRLDDALVIVHADHGDPQFLLSPEALERDARFAIDPGARLYQAADVTYGDGSRYEQLQNGDSSRWRSIAVEVLSSGLLLVKFPSATAYTEDTRPVDLMDLAPTILAHFKQPTSSYAGTPIPLIESTRERVFYAHSRAFDGKLSKYRLTSGGWRFTENIPVSK